MPKEKVFFDTHVYSNASNSRLDVEEWRKALRIRNCACVLTPITLLELLDWLVSTDDDAAFKMRQDVLRLAWELGGRNVLDFPGSFARLKVCGTRGGSVRFGRKDFRQWHLIAIKARTKEDLFAGRVRGSIASNRKTFGLIPKRIHDQMDVGRTSYVEQIARYLSEVKPNYQELRASGIKNVLSREELKRLDTTLGSEALKLAFVQGFLKSVGMADGREREAEFINSAISRLDAAFTHRKFILRQALTTDYRFEEDASAFNDLQLLFYLTDPSYVFVTEDKSLRHAVAKSLQANRIISFDQFIAESHKP